MGIIAPVARHSEAEQTAVAAVGRAVAEAG